MVNPLHFFKQNKEKILTIKVWFWAAFFRAFILLIPGKYAHKFYGIKGEESSPEESKEIYKKAWKIAFHVNRIGEHTPWESKCLVRALTAQKLLKNWKIPSTLYLGVKRQDGKMVAHAWIRTGNFFVTGGEGEGYGIVAKFRK